MEDQYVLPAVVGGSTSGIKRVEEIHQDVYSQINETRCAILSSSSSWVKQKVKPSLCLCT